VFCFAQVAGLPDILAFANVIGSQRRPLQQAAACQLPLCHVFDQSRATMQHVAMGAAMSQIVGQISGDGSSSALSHKLWFLC
jgi:hypothetical protein